MQRQDEIAQYEVSIASKNIGKRAGVTAFLERSSSHAVALVGAKGIVRHPTPERCRVPIFPREARMALERGI